MSDPISRDSRSNNIQDNPLLRAGDAARQKRLLAKKKSPLRQARQGAPSEVEGQRSLQDFATADKTMPLGLKNLRFFKEINNAKEEIKLLEKENKKLSKNNKKGIHDAKIEANVQLIKELEQRIESLRKKQLPYTALPQEGSKQVGQSRYEKGDRIGPFVYVENKKKGVEPGFVANKAWKPEDTRKMCDDPDHKYYKAADQFIKDVLFSTGDTYKVQRSVFLKVLGVPVEHLSNNQTVLSNAVQVLKKNEYASVLVQDHLLVTQAKFSKDTKHYIKPDYRSADDVLGRVTIPREQSKGLVHQVSRLQTAEDSNFGSVREVLANDLMRTMGIYSQKLKLVLAQYEDGTPKMLMDGTHMKGPNGEPFSDFGGKIVDGYLTVDGENNLQPDQSIENMGMYKLFFLLLGDRDALGSRGDNKGRVGNIFAAIDPGHSLEIEGWMSTNLMAFENVGSDGSHRDPEGLADRKFNLGYKNFSMFEDREHFLQEVMMAVQVLSKLKESGDDLKVFDEYISCFCDKDSGMDFKDQIESMKKAYEKRRNYILKVFEERLTFVDDPSALNVLEGIERITSLTSDRSPNGQVKLRSLRIVNRAEWHIEREGSVYKFTYKASSDNKQHGLGNEDVKNILEDYRDKNELQDFISIRTEKKALVVRIPVDKIATAEFQDVFGIDTIKEHKGYDITNTSLSSGFSTSSGNSASDISTGGSFFDISGDE